MPRSAQGIIFPAAGAYQRDVGSLGEVGREEEKKQHSNNKIVVLNLVKPEVSRRGKASGEKSTSQPVLTSRAAGSVRTGVTAACEPVAVAILGSRLITLAH